uniref:Uncharacterized protein n=1 Tax=Anguilla anguilla TaxID=7936 RepID=A0A0E9WI34_ANGAN
MFRPLTSYFISKQLPARLFRSMQAKLTEQVHLSGHVSDNLTVFFLALPDIGEFKMSLVSCSWSESARVHKKNRLRVLLMCGRVGICNDVSSF